MARWSHYAPGPEELASQLAPERTALLLIDIQNDFGHPDGVLGRVGVDRSRVDGAVTNAQALHEAAHARGLTVVHVTLQTTRELDSRPASLRRERQGLPNGEAQRVCRKGTWGAELYRIEPSPSDLHFEKARYSSFQDTALELQLRARGIDTLVIGGLTTECCVEQAVRDAFHRDYHVFLAEDASASFDAAQHDVCVGVMAAYCALIVRTADVVAAWTPRAEVA